MNPSIVVDDSRPVSYPLTVRKVAEALGFHTVLRSKRYDVVIIGGGPAGLAASVYGASEGLSVLLVERKAPGGQAGTSSRIENYVGFPNGISGDDLSHRAFKQAVKFGAEIILTREVREVSPNPDGEYTVALDGGEAVIARTVVLATGVDWRKLDADGIDRLIGQEVLYGGARADAHTVAGKRVFIIGGGNSAGQAALFFADYASEVTILIRGTDLGQTMSQYLIDQIGVAGNVSVEAQTQVTSVSGADFWRPFVRAGVERV
jgi:thioredoxin reductase (NADPH)